MQDTLTTQSAEDVDVPAHYEVYADRWLIYSGNDWVDSILACRDAGRLYGAALVERWVNGHLYARLKTHYQSSS